MKKILISIMLIIIGLPNVLGATADVNLKLKTSVINDKNVSISIYIDNPSGQEIRSVQSWLKYDPTILEWAKINTDTSPFEFVAPGENTADAKSGIVKIGRSATAISPKDKEIFVAEVLFNVLQAKSTEISFYNFQMGNDGNTSVRVFEGGYPVNVLKTAPSALPINFSANSTPSSNNIKPVIKPVIVEPVRPKNLKITSGPDYVVLAWDKIDNMKGYNIYYSQESGRYLQRRGAGDRNEYYFDGFETGKEYYFAVTAYDFKNKETDYSDEVRIRVGYPNSSTSPLNFTSSQKILSNTRQNVQSGPAEALFIITIFTGFLTFLLVSRKPVMIKS